MSRGLVIALCLAGCLKEAKFEYRDAPMPVGDGPLDSANTGITCLPTVADVSVNRSGAMNRGANVCGPGYQMVFSDVGASMPYQLVVGGMQLLALAQNCNDERGSGVGMFPMAVVNAEEQSPSVVGGMLDAPMTGPVIVQVVVDWSASYTCTSGPGTMQDRSTFTFFPDGHIIRFDRLRQAQQTAAADCGRCAGPDSPNFFITSYTNLTAPTNSELTGAAIAGLVSHGQSATGLRSACLRTLQRNVAFGWRNTSTRVRVTNTSPRSLAFVQDSFVGTPLGPNFADDVTTHMLVSSTTACADLDARAFRYAERPELRIQDQNIGPSLDGIYGGENDSGNTAIDTNVGAIPIRIPASVPVPAGAAVWIDFGAQQNTGVQVEHNGIPSPPAGDDWYRIQRVNGRELIFWFRDEIVDGTVITITPGT